MGQTNGRAKSQLGHFSSERESGAQLHCSIAVTDCLVVGAAGTGDMSEGCCQMGDVCIRVAKVWRVRYAERLCPELEPHALADRELSRDSRVEVEEARTRELITSHIAEDTRSCGLRKGSWIKPQLIIDAAQYVEGSNLIWILLCSCSVQRIAIGGEAKRSAAHARQYATYAPSSENPTRWARLQEVFVLAERQFV